MSRYNDYQRYLKSDHWLELRARKLAQSPWCEVCGTQENRQVNHLRYRGLFDVELHDLMTLCEECHKDYHLALENLGWTVNNAYEAVSMVNYFRKLPIYRELKDTKPTGHVAKKPVKAPYGALKHAVCRVMAAYRHKRPLTPGDVRELIGKLQTLLAGEI